jgi:hypothetical protein
MIVLETAYAKMVCVFAKMAGRERIARKWRAQMIAQGMVRAN